MLPSINANQALTVLHEQLPSPAREQTAPWRNALLSESTNPGQFPRGATVRHHRSISMLSIPICPWLAEIGTGLIAEELVLLSKPPFQATLGLGEGAPHGLVFNSLPEMVPPTRAAGNHVPVCASPKARHLLRQTFARKHLESLM